MTRPTRLEIRKVAVKNRIQNRFEKRIIGGQKNRELSGNHLTISNIGDGSDLERK
jgi:hypothetical protein